ncbi:pentapeptide repeat-containing protein [Nocardia vinacea]|uniref:pentapeptide repeat-containing protein n=1 Tax=Nocardia vinacea TaxID=96468 RepID=UPI0034207542
MTGTTGGDVSRSAVRALISRMARSIWFGFVVAVGGGGVVGFSAAMLFGVPTGFSQPLATFLAGAGALSAGILAYVNGERSRDLTEAHHQADMDRERERHREDSRRAQESALRDRYATIATQIAHDSAAIRQAGVYALTALADDWHIFGEDDDRQVCTNLLQWYLRVPFPQSDEPEEPDLSEREIRQTIVGILTQRRRRPLDDPKSWASNSISLHQVSLPNCEFRSFDLAGLKLFGADLSGADLSGADLLSANLIDAKLTGAKLTGANLFHATLTYADMSRANLTNADMNRANLTSANLTGAKLTDANMSRANLTYADLSGANLTDANLTGACLTHANLTGANLAGASLTHANLAGANMTEAKLIFAKLTDADLFDANLTGANMSGVNMTGIRYNEHTRWPGGFTPPS